ncbi:hypothetical protein ACTXT7_008443 [Hymenolepis weldensis]
MKRSCSCKPGDPNGFSSTTVDYPPILTESEFREYTRVDYNVSRAQPWVNLLYYRVLKIVGSARLLVRLLVGYVITMNNQ